MKRYFQVNKKMLKIHVICQWRFAARNNSLISPLDKLHRGKRLEVSFYNMKQYHSKLISGADVIIFSNVIDREAIVVAEEAKQKGVRMIYDSNIGAGTDPSDAEFLNALRQEEYNDIRSHNVRDRLLRIVELVTSRDFAIAKDHNHIKNCTAIINDCTPDAWYDLITSAAVSSPRQSAETRGKKILFIAPTLMWPHQHISDTLARNLMDMGHIVRLFTPKPPLFHTQAICKNDLFDHRFIKHVVDQMEDIWKIPLLIDKEVPDMVMTVQGHVLPRQILVEIRRRNIRSTVWFIDELHDAVRSCSYGRYFTHVFIQDESSLALHRRYGNPNTFHLPYRSDPISITSGLETMFRLLEENNASFCDTGHCKVGYIQMAGKEVHESERLPDTCTLTLVQNTEHRAQSTDEITPPCPPLLRGGWGGEVRVIEASAEDGFSNSLNRALLETPSDYFVVSSSKIWHLHREIETMIKEFYEDLYLGMILLRENEQGPYTGFLMPSRVLMDAGIFHFSNATASLMDMRYKLEAVGLSVKEICFNAAPLEESIYSRVTTEEESRRFSAEWTDNPGDRINAQRLLNLVLDNAWRLSKTEGTEIIQKSLNICPGFLKGHEYLGKVFIKEGNLHKAKEHLQYIYEKNPEDITSAILYAITLSLTRGEGKAETVLESILNANTGLLEKASAYYQKAVIQQKRGDLEGAVSSFTHALEADPAHTNAMKELALLYMEMGKQDEGMSIMKARLSFVVNEEILNDVGVICWVMGQKEEAYKWFVSALENNPLYKSAVVNIAAAGEELGRIREVREYLQRYLSYYPDDAELRNLLKNIGQGVTV